MRDAALVLRAARAAAPPPAGTHQLTGVRCMYEDEEIGMEKTQQPPPPARRAGTAYDRHRLATGAWRDFH
jgi:hypothetical protein